LRKKIFTIIKKNYIKNYIKNMDYKQLVNNQTGSLGPISSAIWPGTVRDMAELSSLKSQPLLYYPESVVYTSASDIAALPASSCFSFGGRKSYSRRSHKVCKSCGT
jgi:hypothetical protein